MKKTKPDKKEDIDKILNPIVKEWFYSKFKSYSIPQLFGVMEIHSRNNVLISAPTGATKTLTSFLSVLNELVDSSAKGILEDKVYCIYISPLKALNEDIKVNLLEPLKEMKEIAEKHHKKIDVRVMVRTGDTSQKDKSLMLKKPPHILITTPESLAIMLSSKKFREHLRDVNWAIIDEIHSLAEGKRGVHLSMSLERLQILSPSITRVGLSATVAPIYEVAKFLVGYSSAGTSSGRASSAETPSRRVSLERTSSGWASSAGTSLGRASSGNAPGGTPENEISQEETRDCRIIDVQFIKDLDLKVLSPVDDLIDTTHGIMRKKMYELIHDLISKHKTTLIFTNTRAATERVVDTLKAMYPKSYSGNIGAHHGSLSKEFRHGIEERLRKGELKVVVSSTSLELGIDIGYIDLVILLGSPKSVARALQRIGRSGHALHSTTKGRIIVLDRDDLVECSVLLKSAMEKKIDKIHLPRNSLDVLVQHIYGMAIDGIYDEGQTNKAGEEKTMSVRTMSVRPITLEEMYDAIKKSYSFHDLKYDDFMQIIDYLSGKYVDLEERHIYQKIYIDEDDKGRKYVRARGKLARMLYMTNIGTIPDEAGVKVKIKDFAIGKIDESFLERLKKGDVFVLGGETYEFLYSRGTVAQVKATSGRPPTVPSWFSEMLPLSFDLANEIGRFRRLMNEKFEKKMKKKEIIDFINEFLYVDKKASNSLYNFFREQYEYAIIPHDKRILIEYSDGKTIFHTLYGRRVNDALSRAVAYIVSKTNKMNVEIGITDNGFYLSSRKRINGKRALEMLKSEKLEMILELAIENSEVLKRRFRHCATRALMILRNYMGKRKRVGRQVVSSTILLNAVKRIDENFVILKEARREVLEDVMDINNTIKVVRDIESGKVKIVEADLKIPSPFAFNLSLQGFLDVLKIDDKMEFLRQMHREIMKRIEGKRDETIEDIKKSFRKKKIQVSNEKLIPIVRELDIDDRFKLELIGSLRDGMPISNELVRLFEKEGKNWPDQLKKHLYYYIKKNFSYDDYWNSPQERALEEFKRGARKKRVKKEITENISKFILTGEKNILTQESKEWLDNFFSGPIPFAWTDFVVKYLKEIWEK